MASLTMSRKTSNSSCVSAVGVYPNFTDLTALIELGEGAPTWEEMDGSSVSKSVWSPVFTSDV
jgi:hypothetical protein